MGYILATRDGQNSVNLCSEHGTTALAMASWHKTTFIVKKLLEHGANPIQISKDEPFKGQDIKIYNGIKESVDNEYQNFMLYLTAVRKKNKSLFNMLPIDLTNKILNLIVKDYLIKRIAKKAVATKTRNYCQLL